MGKTRSRFSLFSMVAVFLICWLSFANVVCASNAYLINGVSIHYDDSSITKNCWTYANEIYRKIWNKSFTNNFASTDNILRNRSDSELTLT